MTPDNYEPIKDNVKDMDGVTTRPMFGYQCFLVSGKFFVGFYNKSDFQIIIRLPKDQQESAIKDSAIKPFSHGAKMGWVELDSRHVAPDTVMKYISKGYAYAKQLAENT